MPQFDEKSFQIGAFILDHPVCQRELRKDKERTKHVSNEGRKGCRSEKSVYLTGVVKRIDEKSVCSTAVIKGSKA